MRLYLITMKKLFLLIPLICFTWLIQAQEEEYSNKYRKWKKQYSEDCIINLKDGALLVSLSTRNTAIKLYRENGQEYVADRMEQEQFEENQAIMKGFLKHFNFCPVYFFYLDDAAQVRTGNTRGIFLNDHLKRDSTITLKQDFFMIAGYGPLEAESYVIPGDTTKPKEYVNPNALDRVLVVKDSSFMQMIEPFPHYVLAVMEKYYEKQIKQLNERFHNYYNRVTKE